MNLENYKKNKPPVRADHLLSIGGVHKYSETDGVRHYTLNSKGHRDDDSYCMGDKGWCIVKRLRIPDTVKTKEITARHKSRNAVLKSLV